MVKRGLILGGLLALFGGAFAYAEGADLSIDVKSASLQLTVPENINIELQPTSSAAVFDSRDLTFNVATNNPTGYTVTMSVPQTAMPHSSLTSTTLPTLDSSTTEANFPANKWGYKTTGDYNPVALTNTDAAWNFDGPTNSQNHTVTLGAKVDGMQPAGIYTTTITFNVVVNPNSPKETIIFNSNNENATGTMGSMIAYRGEATTIKKNVYALSGHYFNSWNTLADGTGVGYGDEDEIVVDAPVTLYAQWQENSGGGSGSGDSGSSGRTLRQAYREAYQYHNITIDEHSEAFAMQNIALEIDGQNVCERTTVIGSEAYVQDLRDDRVYWITKLKDGKCWMTQNLDYDIKTTEPLEHTLSDIGWTENDASKTWTPTATAATVTFSGTSVPTWVNSDYVPYSAGPGDVYIIPPLNSQNETLYVGTDTCIAKTRFDNAAQCAHFHSGNYYNWTATIAENTSNTEYLKTQYNSAPDSICPAGWRLPYGKQSSESTPEYTTMLAAQGVIPNVSQTTFYNGAAGFTKFRLGPLYYIRGGEVGWDTRKLSNRLSIGHYVTSTVHDSSQVNDLFFNTSTVEAINARNRYRGYSVRCIAR